MRVIAITIFLAIVITITPIFGSEQKDSEYLIDTPEEAIKQALEYTGFDRLFDPWGKDRTNVSVFREVASDTSTEYSKKEIDNKDIWRIQMRNIIIDLSYTPSDYERKHSKDFEIVIDARSGDLLEIRGIESGLNTSNSSFDIFDKMAIPYSSKGEYYHTLPRDKPNIDFLKVLDLTKSLIFESDKMRAVYVLYSKSYLLSGEILPVWIIFLDELPPFEAVNPGFKYTSMREVVNAMTGESYGYSCSGKPVTKGDSAGYKDDNKQDDK